MGGYDAEKKESALAFTLAIDEDDQHMITGIAEHLLDRAGGFYQNVPIYNDKKFYYLLNNDHNPKTGKYFLTFDGEVLTPYYW